MEIDPHICGWLLFDQMPKQFNRDLFNNYAESTGYSHGKKWTLIPYFTLYTKINSKWIIDVKSKTIELLEKNIKDKFCDLEIGKDFLDIAQKNKS